MNTPIVSENNENNVNVITSIYPKSVKNRKGFRVGDIKINFDTNNAPFETRDQVDLYLNELMKYIQWASTKKNPKDQTLEDQKKNIHDFLKSKKIEQVFSPKVVEDQDEESKLGGKRKKKTKRRKMKRNKTEKNKNRK